MKKIGLFYAPGKGSTEKVAQKVIGKIGSDHIDLHLISENTTIAELEKYDKLVFGISTVGRDNWDAAYSKIGWDFLVPKIAQAKLSGKTVAIFGLGNHIMYPDNFVDSMGVLAESLKTAGANIVGSTNANDYDFDDSQAVIDDKFVGVAIDEDNNEEDTDERLDKWIELIKPNFGL